MNRTACTIVGFTFALMLALAPGGIAATAAAPGTSSPMVPRRHRSKPTVTAAEEQGQAPMMQPRRGMMGHGGMMLQQHLEWLSQQLKLSDEQRAQAQTLLRNHAKDIIRLRAEIDTMTLDVPPLLEANPVDLAKVKQLFQAIAAKEADFASGPCHSHAGYPQAADARTAKAIPDYARPHDGRWRYDGPGGMMGQAA